MIFTYLLEEIVKPLSRVGLCKKNFYSIQICTGRIMLVLDNRRLGGPIFRGKDQSTVAEELADTETHCD